ncbi:MAG: hypothetical protein AMXMBFR53_39710 [Gemmatimonadota bacterium]
MARLETHARRGRRARQKLAMVVTAAVAVGVVALVLALAAWEANPKLADDTLCPSEDMVTLEVAVVLDASDEWTEIQRGAVLTHFNALTEEVPRFGRVTVFQVSGDLEAGQIAEPVKVLCNPGSLDQVSSEGSMNPVRRMLPVGSYANPERLTERWTTGYASVMDSLLVAATVGAGEERSPLLETLRSVAIVLRNRVPADRPVAVYIFSDLYQNSGAYSFYRGEPVSTDSARAVADLARLGTTSLKDMDVYMYMLTPPTEFLGRADLVRFWEAFVSAQGGQLMSVSRVER